MSYYQQLAPYKIKCNCTGKVINLSLRDSRLSVAKDDFYVVIFERLRDIVFFAMEANCNCMDKLIPLQNQADFVLIYRPQDRDFQINVADQRLEEIINVLQYAEYIEAFSEIRDMIKAWKTLDFFEKPHVGKQLDLF